MARLGLGPSPAPPDTDPVPGPVEVTGTAASVRRSSLSFWNGAVVFAMSGLVPSISLSSVFLSALRSEFSSGPSSATAATASVAKLVTSTAPTIRPCRPKAPRRDRARFVTTTSYGPRSRYPAPRTVRM